ncbi:hypothetical protein RvY_11330 [Ramazzottius varieornatus]|uniref:Uncharacterized protein n=1 Tax=Ramazzottius varieornatus TaxID=947166 RepID=A0A1D1VHU2_RAMVA|nr:hypothetical protein RvY_11330 [Ramazzottius varieornatus]
MACQKPAIKRQKTGVAPAAKEAEPELVGSTTLWKESPPAVIQGILAHNPNLQRVKYRSLQAVAAIDN